MPPENESYDVGYGKPPKNRQFKKGKSGNPKGRPKKDPDLLAKKVTDIFTTPVASKLNGKVCELQPKEIEVRNLLKLALQKNDYRAIGRLLKECKAYGLLPKPFFENEIEPPDFVYTEGVPDEYQKFLWYHTGKNRWPDEVIRKFKPLFEATLTVMQLDYLEFVDGYQRHEESKTPQQK